MEGEVSNHDSADGAASGENNGCTQAMGGGGWGDCRRGG